MFFGVEPPAPDLDPAYSESCYSSCPAIYKKAVDDKGQKRSDKHILL